MNDRISTLMDEIKAMGPSWKTDVSLLRNYGSGNRLWTAAANDIWGHMSTPEFSGPDPIKCLEAVKAFVQRMLQAAQDNEDIPFIDDDGVGHYGCTLYVTLGDEDK